MLSDDVFKETMELEINKININTNELCKLNLEPLLFSHKAVLRFKDPQLAQLILKHFHVPYL